MKQVAPTRTSALIGMKSPLLMLTGVSLIALSAVSGNLWFDWFGLGVVAIGLIAAMTP